MPDPTEILNEARTFWAQVGQVDAGELDVAALWEDLDRILNPDDGQQDCPECDGQGHHDIRQFGRHVEDEYVSVRCSWCDGTGTVWAVAS